MLPTNVMTFMKKMVTTNESQPTSETNDSGTALSKLRQTLSSSLMTAQDKVTKFSPARQSAPSESATTPSEEKVSECEVISPVAQKPETVKPVIRTGTCRVCLKSFKPEDFFRTCCECQQKVCEDCASYSKPVENEDQCRWRCSICRRKIQSRVHPVMQQDSTDSLLDVPVLEALQRRHSDVKIGSSNLAVSGVGSLSAGLAPPRSPELRRHSDVSPASLKELEKVAGERREELRWERELEWRQHKRPAAAPSAAPIVAGAAGSIGLGPADCTAGCVVAEGGSTSASQGERQNVENRDRLQTDLDDTNNDEIAAATSGDALALALVVRDVANGVAGAGGDADDETWRHHRNRTTRRKSRVIRQHSYDDELKSSSSAINDDHGGVALGSDGSLGTSALPRRASAYDVYAVRSSSSDSGAVLAQTTIAATISSTRQHMTQQQQTCGLTGPRYNESSSNGGNGVSSSNDSEDVTALSSAVIVLGQSQSRRPSIRAPGYDSSQPLTSPDGSSTTSSLGVDDDRRMRRRSSQIVDLSARTLPQTPTGCGGGSTTGASVLRSATTPPRSMEDMRQSSIAGEDIKIVIHDVDSDPNFNARPGAKRHVVLHRDPSDKGHRTRGFGMRVVGGKTGSDGRLFAYIVWTVPGGPAEKGGLQQGDKVLEWDGVPLTDRSFEEVCAVMDRTGEVVELYVEHATELRMCDLLDEPSSLMTMSRRANENLVILGSSRKLSRVYY